MNEYRLQAENSCNFDQFTDIIMRLLNAAWGQGWGTFCEAFPNGRDPDNVKLPVITYTLVSMSPGVIGRDGTREIKPRHRGTYYNEDNNEGPKVVDIYGRIFDCKVVFEIWEENNTKATALATRFMEFMDMYVGYIKSQGVKEVIFEKYSNEAQFGMWRDNVISRSLEYFVRLEHLSEMPSDVIEKVTAIVSAKEDLSDDSISKEAITLTSK
jgi:hypothetical protein